MPARLGSLILLSGESDSMDSSQPTPKRIGAYDVVDVIGRGGMGTVFRGNDPRIGRPVAIKVLTAATEDPDLLIRFYREAKYTGSLHHQNIVTVYELGHEDGVPYLVMEYLEGVSLENIISGGRPMPVAEKLGIILQVCSGLSYAHKRGLVHRDIKPANIVILEDGTAKIVDFGIALLGGGRLTRTGHVVGSLNYMSPEQLSGNTDVDARTDVYSTAVVLFQLLTGVLPFEGGSTAATLRKIVQDPPPPLSKYIRDCPQELETIVQKALAKNREERYASPEDFSLDLARTQQQYLKKMLADMLQQATDSMRGNDLTTARQQVLQVLRAAPQDIEAAELLRQIKQKQEQQQHEQQVLQLQMKAEEAFRKNQLVEALHFAEQGIRLDPGNELLPGLRDAIAEAQAKSAAYREALKRAESALRSGDLEDAKRGVEEAQEILPSDPAARELAAQIRAHLEQQQRAQRAGERQKQFALAVNTVEKAMADARMLLFLGQVADAQQVLEKVESEVAQLPPQWAQQFEAIKKETQSTAKDADQAVTQDWVRPADAPTAEIPAPFNATVVMQPGTDVAERGVGADAAAARASLPVAPAEPTQFTRAPAAPDVLYPKTKRANVDERPEVAPELREFLEPEPRTLSRPMIWLGIATAVLAIVFVWLIAGPKLENASRPKTPRPGISASYTYAEINAEPWALVTGVVPENGETKSVIGQFTPLRVKLAPGEYSVTLRGPNQEEKRVDVSVPRQGGVSCFVIFRKPDLNRIVRKE